MSNLYIACKKVRSHVYRLPSCTHTYIIIKLGRDIEARLRHETCRILILCD